MTRTDSLRHERMYIRIDAQSKRKLERAARYAHKSMSDFVLEPALDMAETLIQKNETIALSRIDQAVFLDALDSPPEPNGRLKRAFSEHKKRVRS